MLQTLNCIALRTVKYNDRHSILTAYSREIGRVSFLVPAGAGREAVRRRAFLMPMGLFSCIGDLRPLRDIATMRDPRPTVPLQGLLSDPVKGMIAMFVAEVLHDLLREQQSDPLLFDFASDAIMRLDGMDSSHAANFHICFLYRLTRFVGIEPDTATWEEGRVFDMVEAVYRDTPPLHSHYLTPEQGDALHRLSRISWDNMHLFRFNRDQRNAITDLLLQYYSMHYATLPQLRSLDILRQLL